MNNYTDRFVEIFNGELFKKSVYIVGAGSVGSNVALHLAKMGVQDITVCDNDKIEEENIGVSLLYGPGDIGQSKVVTLAQRVESLTGIKIKAEEGVVTADSILEYDVIISSVDSVKSRQDIFQAVLKSSKPELYVDTAMGGLIVNIKVVNLNDINRKMEYSKWLMSLKEEDVPQLRCTMKSTLHGTSIIASVVEDIFIKYAKNNISQVKNEIELHLGILSVW